MKRLWDFCQFVLLTAVRFVPFEFFGGLVLAATGASFLLTRTESAAPTGFEPVFNASAVAWFCFVVGVALLVAAYVRGRVELSLFRVLATQYEPASPEFIAGFLAEMQKEGRVVEAKAELARIRSMYGEGGIRNGHVMWIMKKLHNELPAGATPPSFTPPYSEA